MITQLNRVCNTNTGSLLIESRPCIDCHQSMRLLLIYLFGCPNKMLSWAKEVVRTSQVVADQQSCSSFCHRQPEGAVLSNMLYIFVPLLLPVMIRYLSPYCLLG